MTLVVARADETPLRVRSGRSGVTQRVASSRFCTVVAAALQIGVVVTKSMRARISTPNGQDKRRKKRQSK